MQILPYDGYAEFYGKSAKEYTASMRDIWASEHLVDCGKRFADMTQGYHVMVGYKSLIFGHADPEMGGGDGILAGDARLKNPVRKRWCELVCCSLTNLYTC